MSIAAPERIDPPAAADERTMLDAWLDFHRATLAQKCEGLSDQQLREQAVPPSNLSLLGLIRHMTEVEQGWFSRTVAGMDVEPLYSSETNRDADFEDIQDQDPAEAFAAWCAECERSRQHAATVSSLDQISQPRRVSGDFRPTVRWIMVHMIEEYARHNGHADFLRERIDGATGD